LTEEVAKPIFGINLSPLIKYIWHLFPAQIVSAVAHLHSKNVCHRDIKGQHSLQTNK
jgi:serine/threonine protein kinase